MPVPDFKVRSSSPSRLEIEIDDVFAFLNSTGNQVATRNERNITLAKNLQCAANYDNGAKKRTGLYMNYKVPYESREPRDETPLQVHEK